jgi:hypothetical protein
MMNVTMHLRDIECCGVNCGELVQDIILEVPGCIVMVMNALILQQHYILIATCVRFSRQKMHGYSLGTGICLLYVICTVH